MDGEREGGGIAAPSCYTCVLCTQWCRDWDGLNSMLGSEESLVMAIVPRQAPESGSDCCFDVKVLKVNIP